MVRVIFEENNILEAKKGQELEDNQKYYYRIDANLPLEKKKEIIIRAFETGNMVFLDELNSCIDDGLEKILNAVLTGMHPDTKQPSQKAGFMLVATANEIDLEGRSMISPALMHRFNYVAMTPLKEYTNQDLIEITQHICKEFEECDEFNLEEEKGHLLKFFQDSIEEHGKSFNLRIFSKLLKDEVQSIIDSKQAEGENLGDENLGNENLGNENLGNEEENFTILDLITSIKEDNIESFQKIKNQIESQENGQEEVRNQIFYYLNNINRNDFQTNNSDPNNLIDETLQTFKTEFTEKKSTLNTQISTNDTFSEEFLKPKQYSGIGVKAKYESLENDGQITGWKMTIEEVFENSYAKAIGLQEQDEIIANIADLKKATNLIRNNNFLKNENIIFKRNDKELNITERTQYQTSIFNKSQEKDGYELENFGIQESKKSIDPTTRPRSPSSEGNLNKDELGSQQKSPYII